MHNSTSFHTFTASKPYAGPHTGPNRIITVTAELHKIGEQSPYFSVTAEIRRVGARDFDCGGCLHEEVLRYWPELAPVVAMHCSSEDGTPMHAEGNGWYFLAGYYGGAGEQYHYGNGSGAATREQCLRAWAEHVRIPFADADKYAESFKDAAGMADAGVSPQPAYWARVRNVWRVWMESQRPRWQREAQAAIELLQTLASSQAAE